MPGHSPAPAGSVYMRYLRDAEDAAAIRKTAGNSLQQNAKAFLIGRYHHNVPKDFHPIRAEYPGLKIDYYTAHRVKGMTCDYAIILDVDSGMLGFPSDLQTILY
jgi:hypothetical protein